jgi:hypothetical protein
MEIVESGCTDAMCTSSSGSDVCDRGTGTESLYSRLSPPIYIVQESIASNSHLLCQQIRSDKITFFAIFGDCSASVC